MRNIYEFLYKNHAKTKQQIHDISQTSVNVVNNENDGKYHYLLLLELGDDIYNLHKYRFDVWSNNKEEAVYYTVIYIEQSNPELFADKAARNWLDAIGNDSDFSELIWNTDELQNDGEYFDNIFQIVDATKNSEQVDEYNCHINKFAKDVHVIFKKMAIKYK